MSLETPADNRDRKLNALTQAMLAIVAQSAGKQHFVVHAESEDEKWFLMFEGVRLMLGGIADNRRKQLICVSPDETARSKAKGAFHNMRCLLPLEFETINRFSGIDHVGCAVQSRVKDIQATNDYGFPRALDPDAFIVLADIDYSPELAQSLRSDALAKWPTGESNNRALLVKRAESGLRNVLKSRQAVSVLFHVPGKTPIFELPPGKVERANVKGGCLAPVLLIGGAAIGSAAAGLIQLLR